MAGSIPQVTSAEIRPSDARGLSKKRCERMPVTVSWLPGAPSGWAMCSMVALK